MEKDRAEADGGDEQEKGHLPPEAAMGSLSNQEATTSIGWMKIADMRMRTDRLGVLAPFSQLQTAARVTPRRSANWL